MSLRTRVAAAAGVGVLAVLAVVCTVLYLSYAASLRSRVDGMLVDSAQQATSVAASLKRQASDKGTTPDVGKPITVGTIEMQVLLGPVDAGDASDFGALTSRDVAVSNGARPAYFTSARMGDTRYRVYTTTMPGTSAGALVRTARADSADDGALRGAAALLAALTVAGAAIAFGAARLTAGRVLRPIAELTGAVEHVTRTGDLHARLRASATDEVGRLSTSFDRMLAELEQSVSAQRQLVADASHELRTPLTSLTTNLELLGEGAGLADPQAPELLREARQQAGRLRSLVDDLLDLARYGESEPHREDVRLDLLVEAAVRRAAGAVTGVTFAPVLRPCLVRVDPAAVERAVANLLDNAVKWSPPGGVVRVQVDAGELRVSDDGPGIAPADLPHVFERFYRSPGARGLPGAGLGLAIVGRVAEVNGGSVDIRTGATGSTFRLRFPAFPCGSGRDDAQIHPGQVSSSRPPTT